MTAAAILGGAGSSSRLPSAGRAGVAVGLALTALLAIGSHSTAHAQESADARMARENLPAVVTLIAIDDHDQPLALGSGFFITCDGVVVINAHVVGDAAKVFARWCGQSGTAVKILNFAREYDPVTLQLRLPALIPRLASPDAYTSRQLFENSLRFQGLPLRRELDLRKHVCSPRPGGTGT